MSLPGAYARALSSTPSRVAQRRRQSYPAYSVGIGRQVRTVRRV